MADAVLLFGGKFRETLLQFVDHKNRIVPEPARPADRLPEPYRSRLLSCLNSIAIDLGPVSEETEEQAVQNVEHDLANGGRER